MESKPTTTTMGLSASKYPTTKLSTKFHYNFANEIYNLRNQYRMNIPDNQIDQTLEQDIQNRPK